MIAFAGSFLELLFALDTPYGDKRKFVKDPAELLMTTPESLEVMLLSPRVPAATLFADLRFVIVDEIHAMAGTDRGAHLMSVIERLAAYTKNDVRRIGLSATVGNPPEILRWVSGSSRREGVVVDPPKNPAPRQIAIKMYDSIAAIAQEAGRQALGNKSLFFCQSRALSETVAERMRGGGVDVFVHHSSVSLEERRDAEQRFQHGTNVAIVCTSTLELGIDVGDLDLVFQANAPSAVSSFLQRMGRTGRRAGQTANTTFYCEDPDEVLQSVAIVELAREGWVESVASQARCWPVLVHQLLALTLQFGALSAERCWDQLSRAPDFGGVAHAEFEQVVAHMKQHDYLFESGGLLSVGTHAERVYGRKNFAELYAVFSSPVLYRVQTAAGKDLGSLEQNFVDRLVDEMSSFLLGGRAWTVEHVNHPDRIVRVREAPRGQKPSWGGFLPQHLGFALCQRMRRILMEDVAYPYVDAGGLAALAARRADLGQLLRTGGALPSQIDEGTGHLWTFAGGQINHTLMYALELTTGWKVVADNLHLRLEGAGITHTTLDEAVQKLRARAFWTSAENQKALFARSPDFRLSKFQQALPPAYETAVVSTYLLDIAGAERFLNDPVHSPVVQAKG